MRILAGHYWSGNLRELRNAVRRAALFAQTTVITPDELPILTVSPAKSDDEHDLTLRPHNEREHIEAALKRTRGNKTMAAQLLKIDRKTLYNKIHQYGIGL